MQIDLRLTYNVTKMNFSSNRDFLVFRYSLLVKHSCARLDCNYADGVFTFIVVVLPK